MASLLSSLIMLGACTRNADDAKLAAETPNTNPEIPDRESKYPLEPMSGKTASEYFRDEGLSSGWNLGNTFDAFANGRGNETAWGNPPANQALMNGVKAAGFDIIRIPVTWMGHIGPAPDHLLSEALLDRVAEVAGYAHNAGLKVIINLHHDGAVSNREQSTGWLLVHPASSSTGEYERITRQFTRVWRQIAAYFKNHGDWLIFEPFNELHDGGWGEGSVAAMRPQFEVINQWNQAFTDTVRMTGANNATRFLVIPGYSTNMRHTLSDYFILPNDSAPGRQIVSFHYYDPYEFGIAGTRSEWGSEADRQKTDSDFAPFKTRFIDNQIPVIIGECGAVLQLFPDDPGREENARRNRLDYLEHIFGTAGKYGIVPIYWDNGGTIGRGEKFGLINRRDGAANSPESELLINAMTQKSDKR